MVHYGILPINYSLMNNRGNGVMAQVMGQQENISHVFFLLKPLTFNDIQKKSLQILLV
jgi:hypothetical protein